jgi:hypothetical protein
MDKLEHYLDQICRSIGGPKSLRQHVRRELREHLLDAAAEHRAAGMSEEEALDRAMLDFGGPEEVRLGLEETHGHRLLPVVIDKAMQWKERTMRAKWLWMTWAHLALAGVIVLEVMWLTFANMFLVPRFQKLKRFGVIDPAILEEERITWMASFLDGLNEVGRRYTPWLLLSAAVVCGLFEWRVRSENKSFIRLSAWGTAAVGLMVAGILTAASLVIPSYVVVMPVIGPIAHPFAMRQFDSIDESIAALEKAMANKNWDLIQRLANYASQSVNRLAAVAPKVQSLAPKNESLNLEKLRSSLTTANGSLSEAQQAAQEKDAGRVEAALRRFREVYEPIRKAAKNP